MQIDYGLANEAVEGYNAAIKAMILERDAQHICDIGGGATPELDAAWVAAHGQQYTVLDISAEQLAKAPKTFSTLCCDVCDAEALPANQFDFVFSRMVAEHVGDSRRFHAGVHKMLKPGGIAFHFFPTLYSPPFVVNRLAPEWLSSSLLGLFNPRSRHLRPKFPAHYRWCYGPTQRQIARLKSLGWEVLQYKGFFGHSYYHRLGFLDRMQRRFAGWLQRHPIPALTSYAYLVLAKTG